MIKANPKISVIMPVFNSQDTVYFSIKSVLNQTYDNFDFIIVNDGSTDNSENIILSFKDIRIKYYKTDHKGRSFASNYGISKATTEYIARLDSDDMFFKDKLMRQMKYLIRHPEIDLLFCWSIFYEDTGLLRFWKSPESDIKIKEKLRYLNPINHSTVIYKKDAITKISGYDENLEINEDYDLWLRVSKDSVFYCLKEYFVFSKLKVDTYKKKFDKDLVCLLTKNIKSNHSLTKKNVNDLLGRVEYFYGSISEARKLLKYGNIFRNLVFIFYSYIPRIVLNKVRGKRLTLLITSDFIRIRHYRDILLKMLK